MRAIHNNVENLEMLRKLYRICDGCNQKKYFKSASCHFGLF